MRLKQTLLAIAVAATTLTGATQQASAGPLACVATATGPGLGWLAYAIVGPNGSKVPNPP